MTPPAPSKEPSATRKRSLWLAMTVVSLLFTLILLELGGRLLGFGPRQADIKVHWSETGWAKEYPLLGWTNRSGTFRSVEKGEALMSFWPGGRRASWYDDQKTADKRVHFYGGSFTQAYGVGDEESFAFRLNAMFPDIHFDNLGVAGYGGYQALLRMREVLDRTESEPKPDLLVYGFIGGHLRRNFATSRWIKWLRTSKQGFLVPPRVRTDGEGLEEFAAEFIDYWPLETRSVLITLLHDTVLALRHDDWFDRREEVSFRVIAKMHELVEAKGKRFLVVLLDDVPEDLPGRLAQAEIPFIDCTNPAFGKDPKLRTGGDTGHPSAIQHELWSQCIGRWISEAGLASKPQSSLRSIERR